MNGNNIKSNTLEPDHKSINEHHIEFVERIKEQLKNTGLSQSNSFEVNKDDNKCEPNTKKSDGKSIYSKQRNISDNNKHSNDNIHNTDDIKHSKQPDSNLSAPGWPSARKISAEGACAWQKVVSREDVFNWHKRYTPWFNDKDIGWLIQQYDARISEPRVEYLLLDSEFTKLLKISKT